MVKISVIIPIYNMEQYILECLESVRNQTLKEIEIICIDDGSTDSTYDILLDYSKEHENIIVLRQENRGAGNARNKGIESAKGKYVCFMDADDCYASDEVLEKLYTNAEANHADICGGNIIYFVNNERKKKELEWFSIDGIILYKDFGEIFFYQCFIFSTKLIKEKVISFPPYRIFEDPPFFLNAMIQAGQFYAMNEVVYVYRNDFKIIKTNFDIALGVLKGFHDCFKIAQEHNLVLTYKKRLRTLLDDYMPYFYPYIQHETIWNLICSINKISAEWIGETAEICGDRQHIEDYVEGVREKRKGMFLKCQESQGVVIYGAGGIGKFVLKMLEREGINVIGFAVSKKDKDDCEGYKVREIKEYDRDVPVIVAAGKDNAKEILRNLEQLQFKNVNYIEYRGLRILAQMDEGNADDGKNGEDFGNHTSLQC